MRKLLLIASLCISSIYCLGQDNQHMAFYGVDYDTAHHKHDSIFSVDSSHFAILGCAAAGFNTGMQNLINPNPANPRGVYDIYTYSKTQVTPGSAFTFGFDYMSREKNGKWFFTIGIEATHFTSSGVLYQTQTTHTTYTHSGKDSVLGSATDTSAYTIQALMVDFPLRAYFRIAEGKKCRFSAGAGISIGFFIGQMNSLTSYGLFNLSNPVNLGSVSLRLDVALGKKTWIALEPFYAMQMYDASTHIASGGLKLELL